MCMLCKNVVSTPSGLADSDGADILVCSVVHEDECLFATDDEVRGATKRVAGYKLSSTTKADFQLRQQAIGFTNLEHGILQDPALEAIVNLVANYGHDRMHGIFPGGDRFHVLSYLNCPGCWMLRNSLTTDTSSFGPTMPL